MKNPKEFNFYFCWICLVITLPLSLSVSLKSGLKFSETRLAARFFPASLASSLGYTEIANALLSSPVLINNKIMTDVERHITKIDEGIFMCANIYPDLDKVMDVQDAALK